MYKESYLIVEKTEKEVVKNESRKKLRRIARRKYSKEYSEEKTMIIVSGNSLKEAISLYKKETKERAERGKLSQAKASSKSTKKAVKTKASKKATKQALKPTMLEQAIADEKKAMARLNKGNAKKA